MLILSRQRDEDVVITVPPSTETQTILCRAVDLRGDKVRLGFTAPKEVAVHRREIFDAIRRENVTAVDAIRKQKKGKP